MKTTRKVAGLLFLSLLIIQPVLALAPNDAEYVYQTYLKQLGAESAWDISTGSRDVIVAVIDTGVDISHQDLVENIFVNYGEIPNRIGSPRYLIAKAYI